MTAFVFKPSFAHLPQISQELTVMGEPGVMWGAEEPQGAGEIHKGAGGGGGCSV